MKKSKKKLNVNHVGAASSRPHFEGMAKENKGITLIALIITIIVMIILIGVTVAIALEGEIFETAGTAALGTEKHEIYDQILGAMKLKNNGNVNVKETYEAVVDMFGTDKVTPTNPTKKDEITTEVTFTVTGERGTYTYKITGNGIELDNLKTGGEEIDYDNLEIGAYVNYPVDYINVETTSGSSEKFTPDNNIYKGWRILSVNGNTIKLVSAGIPLNYQSTDNGENAVIGLTTGFWNKQITGNPSQSCTFMSSGFNVSTIEELKVKFDNKFTEKYSSEGASYTDKILGKTLTNTDVAGFPKVMAMSKEDVDSVLGLESAENQDITASNLLAIENGSGKYADIYLGSVYGRRTGLWAIISGKVQWRDSSPTGIRLVVTLKEGIKFKTAETNINGVTTYDIETEEI